MQSHLNPIINRPSSSSSQNMSSIIRHFDWKNHEFGPKECWPQTLKTTVKTILSSPLPTIMFWGPNLNVIYNDAYLPILADRHPRILGKPGKEVWGKDWDDIEPMLKRVIEHGESTSSHDQLLLLKRDGY